MTIEYKNISEVRYIAPDGSEQIVQLSGPLREGNVRYDRHKHEGHLKCLCCDAYMKLREARRSSGGSSAPGHAEYFTTSKHKGDCVMPLRGGDSPTQKIDRAKGYRLHINTLSFSQAFHTASGAYDISPNGRITISDPDLRERESFAVNDLKELLAFMRFAKPERLQDTVVIFKNAKIDWDQFFVDMVEPTAVASLADRAKARKKGEAPPFALLKIDLQRGFVEGRYGPSTPVPLEPFDAGETKARRKREVNLKIYIDNRAARWGFYLPGEYYVLAPVRFGIRNENNQKVRDWLNVKIDDNRQLQYVKFIENTPAPSRRNAAKPAPSGP